MASRDCNGCQRYIEALVPFKIKGIKPNLNEIITYYENNFDYFLTLISASLPPETV
jgi:hypothetical protein